jgi:hypothetical protein
MLVRLVLVVLGTADEDFWCRTGMVFSAGKISTA